MKIGVNIALNTLFFMTSSFNRQDIVPVIVFYKISTPITSCQPELTVPLYRRSHEPPIYKYGTFNMVGGCALVHHFLNTVSYPGVASVIPGEAGIQGAWTPAFAGVTYRNTRPYLRPGVLSRNRGEEVMTWISTTDSCRA